MTKHPHPANLKCQKVDEVLSSIPEPACTWDAKLRAVQNGVARAVVPIVKIAEVVTDRTKPVNRKKIIKLTLYSITLLANATSSVNQTRQDALKPNIQNKFRVLCRVPREDDSTSLFFGAGLTDRIKAATRGGKLGRRGYGFAAQAPSAYGYTRGRRSYGFHPYGSQTYFRGYGRGQHFGGKSTHKNFKQVSEWMIKFNSLLGDGRHRGPYKPCNHSLYIAIIIFPHIDTTQSVGHN